MHLCVLDQHGHVVRDKNPPASPDAFLRAVAPFRDDLVAESNQCQRKPCQTRL
jgi:hypothetical protein